VSHSSEVRRSSAEDRSIRDKNAEPRAKSQSVTLSIETDV
jgi:hypothetical protein